MARYLVFARTGYAEPLTHIGDVAVDGTPSVDAVGHGDHWLELALVPAEAAIWVLRDGELATQRNGAPA